MPRAIISPSVLASDFGQLSAECKRMIDNGADWLHMGPFIPISTTTRGMNLDPFDGYRRNGRVNDIQNNAFNILITDIIANLTAISCRTSPWVRPDSLPDRFIRISPIFSAQVRLYWNAWPEGSRGFSWIAI
jgi:hypothetical protein